MAEVAISLALEKLSDALIQEGDLLYGIQYQVEWLRTELRWMKSFLRDADAKRRRKGNEREKNWVRDVREVAHRAEDIIDAFVLQQIETRRQRQQQIETPQTRSGVMGRTVRRVMGRIVRYAALIPYELRSRYKVTVQIKGLRAKIDQIKESRERYGLVDLGDNTTPTGEASRSGAADEEALQSRRRISPHSDDGDTAVVGFEAHKTAILETLLDDANTRRRCVVSIVGPGGIGKTTLAKKVYNSSQVRARFGTSTACVSVSQDFRFRELLDCIAKQVMGTNTADDGSERAEVDPLKLCEFLKGRRYFILLDDVWRTDVWEQVRPVLPDVKNGSRVLVTTRSMDVARSADPRTRPFQLPFLNDEESWKLFLKKALPEDDEGDVEPIRCPQELEGIGRRLVKMCGGLPLALLVLGGLVSRKDPTAAAWMRVAENMDWASTQDGEDCLRILGLSYDDLPHHHLRSCFLYLGAFPEDWEIEADTLIQLWIAEGLIPRTTRGQVMMEDTAQAYLEELAQRSMIQVVENSCEGIVSRFRLHDLFRDLCLREAGEDGFLDVHHRTCTGHTPRRLALQNLAFDDVNNWCPYSNLRSLLVFTKVPLEVFYGSKLLRVIHSQTNYLVRLPEEEMKSMIHLRYLRLSTPSDLLELPSSIGNLCNLMTLDVGGTLIRKLPKSLGMLQTLRHLYLPYNCECPPNVLGNLTNLQTLRQVNARGGWIECGGLEKVLNIRHLSVYELRAAQGEVFLDSLRNMKRLSSLELLYAESILTEFITGLSNHTHLRRLWLDGPMSRIRQLPTVLGFPPSLTQLRLWGSRLEQDPMATLEKLPNLMSLRLSVDSYVGKEMVCTAGGLPRLQTLFLDNLYGLEEWRVEAGAMPNLTSLGIINCHRLRMLPEGLQYVTTLQRLEVDDPREEFNDRFQPDVGEDWYKIQHVPIVARKN